MTRCPRCQRRLPAKGECAIHGRPSVLASVVDDALPEPVAPAGLTLGRLLAVGGSSVVYSVKSATGTPSVLKWGRWRDRDITARFQHEAMILRELGAPLTPTLIAEGQFDGWPYLLMEEVLGETLAAWMSRNGEHGALGEICAILLRVARVLDQVHQRGYVHGDVKPENLVIGGRDTRLLDFGLATREGGAITQPGCVVGTVHYLAPEQLATGAFTDRRTDIYAFGVIAFEMIAGQPPFTGDRRALEYQHRVGRPPVLGELRDVPKEIESLVLACLAKQPESRPQSASILIEHLMQATAYIQTLKGIGNTPKRVLGARDSVVLAWIEGSDPVTVARAVNDVHGIIIRSRSNGVLVAFAAQFHDAPISVALAVCRTLATERCRIVIHATTALVRRSAQGKPTFYGPDIEKSATWVPSTVFSGIVLTPAAAELARTSVVAAADVPGFFRDANRERTDATDVKSDVRFVGRERLLQDLSAIAQGGGVLVGLFGDEGSGKTRVVQALAERLRAQKREVIAIRGRRRLPGDRPDDDRLLDAIGATSSLEAALADLAGRRAVLIIDDAQHFSTAVREQLVRSDIAATRIITSREPMFEVVQGTAKRLSIQVPPLPFPDVERLLRELLQPARLIPDVLLQRLAIRGNGNPGLLIALARDIKHRGGVRREEGSDEWYVAADEIDTLLASPSASWMASRGLEGLPIDVAPLVRIASALGPKFKAQELAAVTEMPLIDDKLRSLVQDGVFAERAGWFEFVDTSLQEAIYHYALEERFIIHAKALRYWLAHRPPDLVGWLARVAYHATGSHDAATTAACLTTLAREATKRGEHDVAAELEQRAHAALMTAAPSSVAAVVRALDE